MPTRVAFLVVLTLLVGSSDSALAGSHANLGVARVEVDDQRTNGCSAGAIALCPISATNVSDPDNAEVDAGQDISYIGAGVSVDPIVPLDVDYVIHGSDGYVSNPIFPFVGSMWMNSSVAPGVPGVFEVRFADPAIEFYYNSVNTSNPDDPIYWHEFGFTFPDGQNAIGYHRIGPFNQFQVTDTDAQFRANLEDLCGIKYLPTRECLQTSDALSDWQKNSTPNARYGLNFTDVEASSNASVIGESPHFASSNVSLFGLGDRYEPTPTSVLRDDGSPTAPLLFNGSAHEGGQAAHPAWSRQEGFTSQTAVLAAQVPNARSTVLVTVAAAGGLLLLLAGFLLYSRIRDKNEAIASAVRSKMHELIVKKPGISPTALAEELGLGWNSVAHHLRVMARTGM